MIISWIALINNTSVTHSSPLWTPQQMMHLQMISDVQIAPNNQEVFFVATQGIKGPSFDTKIYKSDQSNRVSPKLFVNFSNASQPRPSPDGTYVAFLAGDMGKKQLFLTDREGKNPIALTSGEKEIQNFAWSPTGSTIAFVREDKKESYKEEKGLITYNDHQWVNRLWKIDLSSQDRKAMALTEDAFHVRGRGDYGTYQTEFDWSPDGHTLVFAYSPGPGMDNFYLESHLASLDVITKIVTPFPKEAPFESTPRFSPDGKTIAYLKGDAPQRFAAIRRVALRSDDGRFIRTLAATFNEGPFLQGPSLIGWSAAGTHLLFLEPKKVRFHIAMIPIDGGEPISLENENFLFKDVSLSWDRRYLGLVGQNSHTPPEAFIASLSLVSFELERISSQNQPFTRYPKTELIGWSSSDGLPIEGLLTYPTDFNPEKKYPLLLVIHGGPMGFFDESFLGNPYPYPLAAFADCGFMILRPNPRGSCGYGRAFRTANYDDWAGKDFDDIMAGVDAVIEKGNVDLHRLGIMGWSYGGYLTAWAITQTDRFKAASVGAGICNLTSINGTSDLVHFMSDYMGPFEEKKELYLARSPLSFAFRAKTPCLIQHGMEDNRVPVSQAYELYHALSRAGQEPTLILYPGMGHRLTDPELFLEAMQRNLDWFSSHLLKE